ncbi:MAG: hypothetical protein AAGI23_18250 [Bacteroidota bacterium]
MRLFSRLQHYFYQRNVAKQVRPLKRPAVSRAAIESIGILFDVTDLDEAQQVLSYKKQLEREGKRVRLLAYINSRSKEVEANYPFFLRSDINRWDSIPKGQAVEDFMTTSFDLLMVITATSTLPFEYISLLTDARLKVGANGRNADIYDLMLDIPEDKSLKYIIQTIEDYLKVVLPKKTMKKKSQLATT